MAWLDKLRKGLEEVVGQVSEVQAEILAGQYYRAGRAACEDEIRERSPAEAVADLEQAVAADSNFLPDAKRRLAQAYEAVGDLEASRRCYLDAIALLEQDDAGRLAAWIAGEFNMDPDDYLSELHDELAAQSARRGLHQEAVEQARAAVEANRDNLNAYHTLIASLHALGDARQLRQWLFRARERDALGLVEQWTADLGIEEAEEDPAPAALPEVGASQFDGLELPGLEVEENDG